ncbi:type VI secretion system amidase effector protein Tae4 [Paraliomyxa miuraensis]|uniref:type VI secretion system amidase effector protein Tae4 n=1 Tax=Paraliomyxa miuraensis TaxID=376150 RepID=UPI002255597A|nr:type VI secretion system amidase effector protein Tae4 [Paraliomyxa miuraensis]MCX4246496.1 type VI secretion system amidase effector protein Tae4 [Paraliomyxa miuraensis]
MPIPSFSLMWAHFPAGSAAAVKAKIGGNVNMGWVTNTCVIRVSYCFNKAGDPIPGTYPGLTTARGGDGMRYAFRVSEFKPFLEHKYKAPDVSGTNRGAVDGRRGIIMFDVQGWSDATGHFDLWDGSFCAGSEYFDKASHVYLWEC